MTIAEMLVQETGRWLNAVQRFGGTGTEVGEGLKVARGIVAAVYGPPCERYGRDMNDAQGHSPSADACYQCGWPRSMHREVQGE
jgi:hypothetical protein